MKLSDYGNWSLLHCRGARKPHWTKKDFFSKLPDRIIYSREGYNNGVRVRSWYTNGSSSSYAKWFGKLYISMDKTSGGQYVFTYYFSASNIYAYQAYKAWKVITPGDPHSICYFLQDDYGTYLITKSKLNSLIGMFNYETK